MDCSTPGFPVHQQPGACSNSCPSSQQCHPIIHPLLFPSSPAFNLSQHQGPFKWVRWPKYWSFSFNVSPFNEYSGLISFRMNWLDLLAVQGTLKSLLQYHRSKSINSSALSFLYSPTVTSTGEGNGNPLQYSCLESPMDRGAWWATVPGVTKSRTRLSD